jgi:hypothetical protein
MAGSWGAATRVVIRSRELPPCAPAPAEALRAAASAPLQPEVLHMDFILATLSEVASALQYLHAQVSWGRVGAALAGKGPGLGLRGLG